MILNLLYLLFYDCKKDKPHSGARTDADGMGHPEIKYGDSVCYVQHVYSGLWLTYQADDAKCQMGGTQRKVNS